MTPYRFRSLTGIVALLSASIPAANATIISVGMGVDQALIIIESLEPTAFVPRRTYEVNFDFDKNVDLTSFDLLTLAAAADPDLIADISTGGSFGPFINSLTVEGVSLSSFVSDETPSDFSDNLQLTFLVSGGRYLDGTAPPTGTPASAMFGIGGRVIEPGAIDGFVFGPGGTTLSQVPEPSSLLLLAGAGILLTGRRRG